MKRSKELLWFSFLLWLIGCRGVLEIRFEQEQPLSVSSLGKVAYIVGGDVWVMNLDTGQRTRLTRDGYNSRPRWSADGQWLAYQKGDQLWAVEVSTGREYPVSNVPVDEYAWSPVGNRLAYLSVAKGLVIWDAHRQREQTLAESQGGHSLMHFAWDPTGEWLAYGKEEEHQWGLHKVSLNGASVTLHTTGDIARTLHLAGWSRDGHWLAVWIGPALALSWADGLPLCLMPAAGGSPRCLEQKMLLHSDWLSWSPGGQLALIAGGGRETWVNKGLAVLDANTLAIHRLVDHTEQSPIQPAFSPDGEHIVYSAGPPTPAEAAYTRRNDALSQRRIWIVNVTSGQRHRLTNDNRYRDERPLCSSDGRHILFARLDESVASLWLMHVTGGHLQQVVPELTPRPDPTSEYGYIDWQALWNWWQPLQETQRVAP